MARRAAVTVAPARRAHTHTHAEEQCRQLGALRHWIFLLQSFSKLHKTHLAVDRHAHRTLPLASPVLEHVTDWPVEVSVAGHDRCPSLRAPRGGKKKHWNKKLLKSLDLTLVPSFTSENTIKRNKTNKTR